MPLKKDEPPPTSMSNLFAKSGHRPILLNGGSYMETSKAKPVDPGSLLTPSQKAPIKRKQTNFKLDHDEESEKSPTIKPQSKPSHKAELLAAKAKDSFLDSNK